MLIALVINALALLAATRLIDGITYLGEPLGIVLVALVFGAVNVVIKPVLKLLSLPVILLSLGLFTLVINALMLMLTGALAGALGLDFTVDGFGAAFLGALVVSVVSVVLGMVLRPADRDR
ncbi:MAG TPA: phage holin family protein [Gemmatimonadaceae bacterium]|nr:phage holin family protein [Gemmatimonadaceae bacterium]